LRLAPPAALQIAPAPPPLALTHSADAPQAVLFEAAKSGAKEVVSR